MLLHPRCVNCHPDGRLGRGRAIGSWCTIPPAVRGPDDDGVARMECASCHQDQNLELARVPGAPNWHLAPRSRWPGSGRTPRQICEQIKDPARNGGKTLDADLASTAPTTSWWAGAGRRATERKPAPGTQEEFGDLIRAWVDTGAACPPARRPSR